jgi:hypothetical protein
MKLSKTMFFNNIFFFDKKYTLYQKFYYTLININIFIAFFLYIINQFDYLIKYLINPKNTFQQIFDYLNLEKAFYEYIEEKKKSKQIKLNKSTELISKNTNEKQIETSNKYSTYKYNKAIYGSTDNNKKFITHNREKTFETQNNNNNDDINKNIEIKLKNKNKINKSNNITKTNKEIETKNITNFIFKKYKKNFKYNLFFYISPCTALGMFYHCASLFIFLIVSIVRFFYINLFLN